MIILRRELKEIYYYSSVTDKDYTLEWLEGRTSVTKESNNSTKFIELIPIDMNLQLLDMEKQELLENIKNVTLEIKRIKIKKEEELREIDKIFGLHKKPKVKEIRLIDRVLEGITGHTKAHLNTVKKINYNTIIKWNKYREHDGLYYSTKEILDKIFSKTESDR